MAKDFDEELEPLLARDSRYPREAYHFVREALDYTQDLVTKANGGRKRDVKGQELLAGIRDFALRQFGPMACCVLDDWRIKTCEDFGEIVFNLVEQQILSKTEDDSRNDFKGGYDFVEVFQRPFEPALKGKNACDK